MREAVDAWSFVIAAYAVGVGATVGMIGWSWFGMVRAEKRRDESRKRA